MLMMIDKGNGGEGGDDDEEKFDCNDNSGSGDAS